MNGELLLVDDDEDDVFLFRLALGEAGIANGVRAARSGEEALALLDGGLRPVLIVLDIKLAGIDGLETLRRLRGDPSLRKIPVVLLTGSDLDADRAEAERLGCRLFLTKPSSLAGYAEMAAKLKPLLESPA